MQDQNLPIDSVDVPQESSCCGTSACCDPAYTRRDFVRLTGLGAVSLATAAAHPVVAGPFTRRALGDHFVPADKMLDPAWVQHLFERGERTFYGGDDLATIGMPVGGICAGQVYLTGDGRLVYWDIFNQNILTGYGSINYQEGREPTSVVRRVGPDVSIIEAPPVDQGVVLRVRSGERTVTRTLDRGGFPGVRFCGEYPVGYVEYVASDLPVEVSLEAFSPFIPLNAEDSALPATILEFTVRNTSEAEVEVTLAGWLQNLVFHYSRDETASNVRRENRVADGEGLTTILCGLADDDASGDEATARRRRPDYGTMALAVLESPATASLSVPEGVIPDVLFEGEGLASDAAPVKPLDETLRGALARTLQLRPGAQERVTFIVGWCMPNMYRDVRLVGNYYARRFADAAEVIRYVAAHYTRLAGETRRWHDTYYEASLPHWLLDRLHSTVANLASTTCQWWRSGRLWAWEGGGCCHGTCGHVWNYAHAMARLFPELERSVREMQDFAPGVGFNLNTGAIDFRGEHWPLWAADSQGGYILKAYREHQCSSDRGFLERNWRFIRQAMQFLIDQDGNQDGLIEGKQHQTYDQEYYGANTMVGALYLGALRAAEEMAREVGDDAFAEQCRRIFVSGSERTVKHLFNGEYFIQDVNLDLHPQWQYADGCLADQLFGQAWAHQVGLGYLYPREVVVSALQAIWKYNWAPDVGPQKQAHEPERWFAFPGEAGLFTCTWPNNNHLGENATRYKDEIWTGIEYQVAGHMVAEGMLTEALAICRGIHERYHPAKHNPWNEIECGDHYARALASWGVLLALGGFEHHGPAGHIGFAPRLTPEDYRSVFTAAEGWGLLAQERNGRTQINRLDVRWGRLRVSTLALELPEDATLRDATSTIAGRSVSVDASQSGRRVTLTLPVEAVAEANEMVEVTLTF